MVDNLRKQILLIIQHRLCTRHYQFIQNYLLPIQQHLFDNCCYSTLKNNQIQFLGEINFKIKQSLFLLRTLQYIYLVTVIYLFLSISGNFISVPQLMGIDISLHFSNTDNWSSHFKAVCYTSNLMTHKVFFLII